jgi:hypothetical protein
MVAQGVTANINLEETIFRGQNIDSEPTPSTFELERHDNWLMKLCFANDIFGFGYLTSRMTEQRVIQNEE